MSTALENILKKYGIKTPLPCPSDLPVGWLGIVDNLCSDLMTLGWDRDLHQVKEKFGGLRFYVGEADRDMFALIDDAEAMSLKTCELCGERGSVRSRNDWLMTRCDRCFK